MSEEYLQGDLGWLRRAQAAIELRVPMSGDAELDAMIRESRRMDAAIAVLVGIMHYGYDAPVDAECVRQDTATALTFADAVLAECGRKPDSDSATDGEPGPAPEDE